MVSHGIMFHHFHDDTKHIKGQGSISAEQFEQMIRYLQTDKVILSADEWMYKALRGNLKENETCLTFDDNLLCQFEVAFPVLKKHGLKAFWFVYTSPFEGVIEKLEVYRYFRFAYFQNVEDFYLSFFRVIQLSEFGQEVKRALEDFHPSSYLKDFPFYTDEDRKFRFVRDKVLQPERYNLIMDLMLSEYKVDLDSIKNKLWMTEGNVKTLFHEGHKIGLHTHTHPTSLSSLIKTEQLKEYQKNHQMLSKILGEAPDCMSHPCNSYNQETIELLDQLDIKLGFRANMKANLYSAFEYPREDHANILKKMEVGSS